MLARATVLLAFLCSLSAAEDLYDILGIDESATEREIKNAYRKLSLLTHPDKPGGDAELFKEVSRAYEVLSDGNKRALYDAGGDSALEKGVGATDPWGRPIGVQKGGDSVVTVNVPLEDLYKGGSVRATVHRRVVCRGCGTASRRSKGSQKSSLDAQWARLKQQQRGGKPGGQQAQPAEDKCESCGPSCPPEVRVVQRRMGHMIMNQEIQEESKERCKKEAKVLVAEIERGAPEGTEVVFARASEQTPGKIPGDVKVRLRAAKHAVLTRNGTDLTMSFAIPLRDALIGFERTIRHLDGHEVVIANRGVSSHGQVLTLKGEGMPVHGVPSEYGDLHVTLKIVMPKQLTSEERAFAAQHFEPAKEAPPGKQPKPR